MVEYETTNLRNIAIVGHSGSGKTTLTERILYFTKTIDRFGTVEEENTVSDYDPEEKKRKISISASVSSCQWKSIKINLVDTPGYFDFWGEVLQGLRAADVAIISLSGVSGIKVGTEKCWDHVLEQNMPRAFYINELDRENSNFENVLAELQNKFGVSVVPIQYPVGKEENFEGVINVISGQAKIYNPITQQMENLEIPTELISKVDECKNMIIEAVAETDERLIEKYFSDGTLSDEEIYNGLIAGCANGDIIPVMCGSALRGIGIDTLLDNIIECFPAPNKVAYHTAIVPNTDKRIEIETDVSSPMTAFIFKTIADPFVGKLSLFRVMSGKAIPDSLVYNSNKGKEEKLGTMYFLQGKSQISTKEIIAGDIGAVSKLQITSTGDTLCSFSSQVIYDKIDFPSTSISMAVLPKSKGDEDKISSGLSKLQEEDPTIKVFRDLENAEIILSGIGETHLEVVASKLKNKFGADVILDLPKIPYRETIRSIADVQGKHKKQSGGHGQYGDVVIKFEPRTDGEDDLMFVDEIVGGAVPRQYIPAVEKGLRDCIAHGILAGYPVIRLKATLHDGSYHPVDSSEMAFKIASSIAYKKGLELAQPVILEPVMHVEIQVPDEYMGDIMGDINKRRGRVLGMESNNKLQKIIAEVPQTEILRYAIDLRSMTSARGDFQMRFERYEVLPESEAKKVIEKIKNQG
ncbi:MAG: elongation factor G [Bacillota bacterium]|nr:elongation factor G [Bacillota bacterium]